MRVSAELPRGVVSLFGTAARRRRELETALVGGLEAARYEEVVLPVLDYAEPYEPLLGSAARGEVYRFVDRQGELLALRADFTPMLARLLAPRLDSLPRPLRLYYRGDVVRCREAEAGRHQESFQVGAELLGVPGIEGEAEALEVFLGLLGRVAPREARVVLGCAGALDGLLAASDDPSAAARAVARRERDTVRRLAPALLEVVEWGAPRDLDALPPEAAATVASVEALRRQLVARHPGLEIGLDLAEFASDFGPGADASSGTRAYYDGLVFRAYVGRRATPVGGGGRYDRLFARLGAPIPAVGFSFGVDRLEVASPERAAAAQAGAIDVLAGREEDR